MAKQIEITWHSVLGQIMDLGITRVLLYGPPDTGKTTTASKLRDALNVYRVQCSRQQGIEDLLGCYVLRDGATVFVPGPVALAMQTGGLLIADEFDFRNPAHDSIWHSVLDDPDIAEVRLPDGSLIRPALGFVCIATTNATPNAFSPALQRRFELKLFCGQAHPEALKKLAPELASIVSNWQKLVEAPQVKIEMSVSSLAAYSKLAGHYGQDTAARLIFAHSAQEFLSALANNQSA